MKTIAVVVPTIRPESMKTFMKAWTPLFAKHNVELVIVLDGKSPTVNGHTAKQVMGKYVSVLSNFNAGIRNLGFAYIAKKLPHIQTIITLDDDVTPLGDTIGHHRSALSLRVPISWLSTASAYMRGFPYGIRQEAEVVLSHGVWEGVADWDAPTQLVKGGRRRVSFYRGPVPKGIYYPMCSMNLAFKRKMLEFIYHTPWIQGVHRFDDIFAGVESKREIDKRGWAVVSGYAKVKHERASNVFKNLQHEAEGIELNEGFWKGEEDHPYFKDYRKRYKLWRAFINA